MSAHPNLMSSLHWVQAELGQSLHRVRTQIEQYMEAPANSLPLQQAIVELHQVRGTAAMIQCSGIAAVAEEMKHTLQDLLQARIQEAEAAYAGLLGAVVQLTDYIDALSTGLEDSVLVFQPAINELRVARGRGVLTEAELFAEQLAVGGASSMLPPSAHRKAGAAQAVAKAYLLAYQQNLLAWLKGEDVQLALGRMGKIAEQVAAATLAVPVYQMARATAAVVEALLTKGLQESPELKRLFGRAVAQFKVLADEGEDAAAGSGGTLPYQFLFYVGRSRSQGPRVSALRNAYQLSRLLPSSEAVESLRRKIRGPNTVLLNRLSEEIRKDLAQVKDHIDLVVRAGDRAPGDLLPTVEKLSRVADILNMLGLSAMQRVVQTQAKRLGALSKDQKGAGDPVWLEVATALLRVEHSLDDALFRQLRRGQDADTAIDLDSGIPQQDVREGQDALLRELLVDLAKLKTGVDQFIKTGDASGLGEAARMMGDIQSGLRILANERAAELAGALGVYLRSRSFSNLRGQRETADRFADAIACIEYYLEAVQKREPETDRIIDELAGYVERLEIPAEVRIEDTGTFHAQEAAASGAGAQPALNVVAEADVDPEIRAIFVEEAREVLSLLESRLPDFKNDTRNKDALTDIRRAFHTLKGSGRMVGARDLGEFGWAFENMLNRCIEGTLPVSPQVLELLDEAVARLPALIDGFQMGRGADAAAAKIAAEAHLLAKGGPAQIADPEIVATFVTDARERLAQVQKWLEQQDRAMSAYAIDGDVVRSFHTLKGGAALLNAQGITSLSGAIEQYFDALRGASAPLPAQGLALIADAVAELRNWVDRVAAGDQSEPDIKVWLKRLESVESALPQGAAQAAEQRGLVDVFANEAFTQIEDIEKAAAAWARQPDTTHHPRALQRLFQTLHGAAVTAQCPALGHVAGAFEQRMTEFAAGARPGPDFFREFGLLVEGMYQQLDAFREGDHPDDGSALTARVFGLSAQAPEPLAEAIEMPPVAAATEAVTEIDSEVIEMLPVETLETGVDPELVSIFLAEGEELLGEIDRQFDAWERDPGAPEPVAELARALHTLKGSARMSGLMPVGDIAHRLESLLSQVARGDVPRDATLFGRLHNVVDGLNGMLDEVRRGEPPSAGPVLQELEGLGAAPAGDWALEPEPVAPPAVPPPAESAAMRLAEQVAAMPSARDAPPEAPAPAPVAAPAEDGGYDRELVEVFVAEGTELLEVLEKSLTQWQTSREDEPLREIQRALHTLKGGARMAGVMAMGNLAHDIESRVERIDRGQLAADAAAFASLHSDLERLQRMHDGLQRGDVAALLLDTPSPGNEIAAPPRAERAAPEPQVETYELPPEPELPAAGAVPAGPWDPELFAPPRGEAQGLAAQRRETARVPVERLDKMLNEAGEISIYRSRLEQHNTAMQFQLREMIETIARVREQLRAMDIETEAQIAARGFTKGMEKEKYTEFDPLEMDRYSRMQELSRALNESIGDLSALHHSLEEQLSETETLLLQQGRVNTEVQQGLMGTLMVPFSRQIQRLQRVVRQTALDTGKEAEVEFEGVEQEMDRNVLERMVAPLEHLLRNAVVHGIEAPAARRAAGKPAAGRIRVALRREGTQLAIELADDGEGLNYEAIRRTAIERGLMQAGAPLGDEDVAMFIFEAGFSTAREVTQAAGRGVGMDVVAAEVKQLGGTLELRSERGKGARFLVRLPLTLALSQALLVGVGQEIYAIPLGNIESIARIAKGHLPDFYREDGPLFTYGPNEYRVRYLGDFLDSPSHELGEEVKTLPVVLVRLGEGLTGQERRLAVVVDTLYGNREIVSKAVGPQVSSVQGVSGATILPDGRVVLILDLGALVADRARRAAVVESARAEPAPAQLADERQLIMVVDDSITIRRVTERLLDRHGFRVVTAKDGLDAIAMLQTEQPATILLDIEMPRADGFEVAAFVRNNDRLRGVPIIMITSRSGEKHRERARQIGVNRYLIKPYQEEMLVAEVRSVLKEAR
ncbi:MAG TPA: Hpt domain-containing protein [Candidatus Binatia bacterium]|nr:Hpt domain-containing protein [Candidatus Binatia bacterium]